MGRLFQSSIAAADLFTVAIGDRLGFYKLLSGATPVTSVDFAALAGTDERYTREWLEQQAVTGILVAHESAGEWRFSLPQGHAEVLADEISPMYLAPFARMFASCGPILPRLIDAFRTGEGIDWADYGPDLREGQGDQNRPMFLLQLGQEYLPQVPGLAARLNLPGARIADVGCGVGWSSIGMALSFPAATVEGFDLDAPGIELARKNARGSCAQNRVAFHAMDAADAPGIGQYDLVTAFECIHDMPDPVAVLAAMRKLAKPGGTVLVMDERVADAFAAPGDDLERVFYGFSVLVCLPNGRAASPSAATGTVMRTSTLRRYAAEAGFSGVEVLPIENGFFRFYSLLA